MILCLYSNPLIRGYLHPHPRLFRSVLQYCWLLEKRNSKIEIRKSVHSPSSRGRAANDDSPSSCFCGHHSTRNFCDFYPWSIAEFVGGAFGAGADGKAAARLPHSIWLLDMLGDSKVMSKIFHRAASVGLGAREVEEDLVVVGIEFRVDGAAAAEKQLAEISEDGSAARGDAVLHEKHGELREERVNLDGGLESRETDKSGGEIFIGRLEGARHVAKAKAGGAIQNGMATAAARGGEMAAAVVVVAAERCFAGAGLGWGLGLAGLGLGQRSLRRSSRIRRRSYGGRQSAGGRAVGEAGVSSLLVHEFLDLR